MQPEKNQMNGSESNGSIRDAQAFYEKMEALMFGQALCLWQQRVSLSVLYCL